MAGAIVFPLEVGAAIGLAIAAVAGARRLAAARPARAHRLGVAAVVMAAGAGLLLLWQNVLVHDALWYFSYLRSGIVDQDFDLFEEFTLRNPHGMYLPPPGTPVFHLGTALAAAPAAIAMRPVALIVSRLSGLPGGDGYGPLETAAATWTSMMLGVGALGLGYRLARSVASAGAAAGSQVLMLWATPLAFFTFVWPAYPHPAGAFVATVFLLAWWDERPAGGASSFLLGWLGGVLALLHPQDAVFLALPFMDLVSRMRRAEILQRLRGLVVVAAGAVLGFAPQLLAWILTSGRLLPHVYSEIGDPFRWTRPALVGVLFGGYNGLVTWTPIVAPAVAGLWMLGRDRPRLARGLLILLALEWWSIASYGYWWGGASFGARYFLSVIPVFGVGLAVTADRLARKLGPYATAAAAAVFVLWNLLLMAQFRLEWIPHNVRPDFAAVIKRQFDEAPRALANGLVGPFRWNRTVFPDHLWAAVQDGSVAGFVSVIAGAIVLIALMGLWIVRLSRAPQAGPETRGNRMLVRALGAIVVSLLASVAVATTARDMDRRRLLADAPETPLDVASGGDSALSLAPRSNGPTDDRPTAVATPPPPTRRLGERLRLDVISFLRAGERREQGELVATLSLVGVDCEGVAYPIRAGIETAETAPDRYEIRGTMRHEASGARAIQSWWQDEQSSRHYWGHAYLASWNLPLACDPSRILVHAAPGAGSLSLRRVVLSAARGAP